MPRRIRVFPIPFLLVVIPIVIPHAGSAFAQPGPAADSLCRADGGATWTTAYDGLYVSREEGGGR